MTAKKKDIKIFKGETGILLIAPHAPIISQKPKNDKNTGIIAELIREALKCSAIINDVYRKPPKNNKPDLIKRRLDFNIIEQAELHPEFRKAIKRVVDADGKTLVVWIHGMADSSAKYESKLKSSGFNGNPNSLHALIGYGQGPNPNAAPNNKMTEDGKSRLTAAKETVEKFRDLLTKSGLTTILTRENAPNFRGRDPNRMNQWFINARYKLAQVESIQLEIREKDFRDKPENIKKTVKIISDSLSALVRTETTIEKTSVQTKSINAKSKALVVAEAAKTEVPAIKEETRLNAMLVSEAFSYLKDIFRKHFHEAMLEAGEYIISEFFGGDYERAKNPRNAVKIHSLNALIRRLQENSGYAPSKTWVYDAVKLAIDEHHFKSFSVYGKLGHSHKVLLTRTSEEAIKRQLAEETVKQDYTAAELRERINELKNGDKLRVDHVLKFEELMPLKMKELERLQNQASIGVSRLEVQQNIFKLSLKNINKVISKKAKENGSGTKKSGFRDWTEPANNANFCTGCENDCIYCYAKSMARRYGRIKGNQWREMTIRQHDVDKNRKLHNGLVG